MQDDEDSEVAAVDGVPVLTERVNMQSSDSEGEASPSSDEMQAKAEDNSQADAEEFKEVKLCSKNAAFLRHRPEQGFVLHFSTQNARSQMTVQR